MDGQIYAQPLYLSGISIPSKGTHNVVYVATEHNSVYAFDADNNVGANAQPLWQVNLGPSCPNNDFGTTDIKPEVGITGTPVIDPAGPGGTPTLYVVAKTKTFDAGNNAVYSLYIHALDATSGVEKLGGPVLIQGQVNGTGDGNDGNGHVPFSPFLANQRAGLLLVSGNGSNGIRRNSRPALHSNASAGGGSTLYIAFASHGDNGAFHGWVFAYDATTLQQKAIMCTTPNAVTDPSGYPLAAGGIWQAGAGLASDGASIFCTTGHGMFNAGNGSYGDSVIRLNSDLTVPDFFAPADQSALNNADSDFGSGGVVLLPPSVGSAAHQNLLVAVGKEGSIFLLDAANLGGNDTTDHVVQVLSHEVAGVWGVPAYFNGNLFFGPVNGPIAHLSISNGAFPANGIDSGSPDTYGYPGAVPSVSSNGTSNGIVWAVQTSGSSTGTPAKLRAYDATNLGNELYDSGTTSGRDVLGSAVKFAVPTIARGKVYVGTSGQLNIFGLIGFVETPVIAPAGGNYSGSVTVTITDA
ncbi:MAG TPA: hypothetical protein VG944_23410, partial [Fimbriimonas sp.]|nr:hypothetical protein [Fimbriimonas sp.]